MFLDAQNAKTVNHTRLLGFGEDVDGEVQIWGGQYLEDTVIQSNFSPWMVIENGESRFYFFAHYSFTR